MEAIPYVDSLVKEYLLFRGFTGSLRAFNRDLASDRGCGFQPDQLCELVFRKLLPLDQAGELMEVLDFLSNRVYSRLPASYEDVIRKLEVSILRAYIVHAMQKNKVAVVQNFFTQHAELLLSRAESSDWLQWFALPYLKDPAQDPRFQVFFSREWLALVEASFRNFLAEAIQHLPLPTLLRFDTDRLQRQSLQKQVDNLGNEAARLKQQLAEVEMATSVATQPSSQQGHQTQRNAGASSLPSAQHDQRQPKQSQQPPVAQRQSLPTTKSPASQGISTLHTGSQQQSASSQPNRASGVSAQQKSPEAIAPSHSALDLPGASLQPSWSASLQPDVQSSLAELVTATNGDEASAQSQQSTAGEDALSLDSETSSPRMLAADIQPSSQSADPFAARHQQSNAVPSSKAATSQQEQHNIVQPSAELRRNESGLSAGSLGSAKGSGRIAEAVSSQHDPGVMHKSSDAEQLTSHEQATTCCSFSPNGQNLATASADGVVRISAPASLQGNPNRAAVLNCGAPVSVVAWDHRADKVLLVGTKGKGVKAWHLDTKSMISHIQLDPAHPTVLDVACSPTDPSFVCAAASPDAAAGTLTLWNMRAFKKLRSFDVADNTAACSVSFSPDGHTMAAGSSDGCLRIYDVHSSRGAPVASWSDQSRHGHAPAVRYSADGSAVVSLSQSGQLQHWDLRRLSSKKLGQPQWTVDLSSFCVPVPKAHRHMPALAQSGRLIATTSISSALPIVSFDANVRTPKVQSVVAGRQNESSVMPKAFISAVHWHPALSVLCCGRSDGQVWLQRLNVNNE